MRRPLNGLCVFVVLLFVLLATAGCGGDQNEAGDGESAATTPPAEVTGQDLGRFVGEYGTPESAERHRTFWVVEHCDGFLVAGAMWGDASPWYLEPISETEFVQRVPEGQPAVRLAFETDGSGEVTGLRVSYEGRPMLEEYPLLARLHEVPSGFEAECWRGSQG